MFDTDVGRFAVVAHNHALLGIVHLLLRQIRDTKQLIHFLERQAFKCWLAVQTKNLPYANLNLPFVSGMKNQTKKNIEKQKHAKMRYVLSKEIQSSVSTLKVIPNAPLHL